MSNHSPFLCSTLLWSSFRESRGAEFLSREGSLKIRSAMGFDITKWRDENRVEADSPAVLFVAGAVLVERSNCIVANTVRQRRICYWRRTIVYAIVLDGVVHLMCIMFARNRLVLKSLSIAVLAVDAPLL